MERYIVRPQDDYFGVYDTVCEVNIVNGIRTEIEAEWLCKVVNRYEYEKNNLEYKMSRLRNDLIELESINFLCNSRYNDIIQEHNTLKNEVLAVIDRRIKNNDYNPPKDCYYKLNRALKILREDIDSVLCRFENKE